MDIAIAKPSNTTASYFSTLPYDVTLHIVSFCSEFSTVLHWAQACRSHYSFFQQAQEWIYYAICRQRGYLLLTHLGVNTELGPHRYVKPSTLQEMLQEACTGQHVMNDPYKGITSWKEFAVTKTITERNWKVGRAKKRVQVQANTHVRNIGRFKFCSKRKVWVMADGLGNIHAYNAVTDERWTAHMGDRFLHVEVSGDYVVTYGANLCFTVWRFRDATVNSTASPNEEQQEDLLLHHGVIDVGLNRIRCFKLRSPYLVLDVTFSDRSVLENVVQIWDVTKLQLVKCTLSEIITTTAYTELDNRFVMAIKEHLPAWTIISFQNIENKETYNMPPDYDAMFWRKLSRLHYIKWVAVHHDTLGNHLAAISQHGLFLWVQHYHQFLDGSKNWEECALYVDFHNEKAETTCQELCVGGGRVVMNLRNKFWYISDRSPVIRDCLVMLDLRNWQDHEDLRKNPPQFRMLAAVAPATARIEMDEECVYITGNSNFRQKDSFCYSRDVHECFDSWLKGWLWMDSEGNNLAEACQPSDIDHEGDVDNDENPIYDLFTFPPDHPDPQNNNIIIAYDFSRWR